MCNQQVPSIMSNYMTHCSLLDQHYNAKKIDGSKSCPLPNKLPKQFLLLAMLDIQRLFYTSLHHVCFLSHVLWMLVQTYFSTSQLVICYPFNSEAVHRPRTSQPRHTEDPTVDPKIATLRTQVRSDWLGQVTLCHELKGMVGDHSHTCHELIRYQAW